MTETPNKKHPAHAPKKSGNASGLNRLLKSYVRLMDGYGLADTIPATKVVNASWNTADDHAVRTALRNANSAENPASTKPSEALLKLIMQAHEESFANPTTANHNATLADAYGRMLTGIAADAEMQIATLLPAHQRQLRSLHPLLRAPAAEALTELAHQGLRIQVTETLRDPGTQNELVRKQYSYAPNGYSMHGHGLALDLVPLDAKGKPIWNVKHPSWQTIMEVMQKHGFYSMGAEKNWDQPHFELPLKAKEVLHYRQTDDGWRMIPPDRIPSAMLEQYGEHLRQYKTAESIIHNTSITTPTMLPDKTAVARPLKPTLSL